jgi:tryptophan-rich sensory protein
MQPAKSSPWRSRLGSAAALLGVAFMGVSHLWIFMLSTAIAFWPVSRTANWLMVPYLIWVPYVSALNLVIWRMDA